MTLETSALPAAPSATEGIQIPTSAPPPEPAKPDFMSLVPADYHARPWLQDLAKNDSPFEALLKQHDHLHTKIGEPRGLEIPGEGAPDDAVKAFHKALGVPDTPEGYGYDAPDISQEPEAVQNFLKEEAKDESLMKLMREEAHKLGVTPAQFKGLAAALDQWKVGSAREVIKAAADLEAKATAETKEAFKQVYGDRADYVEKIAKETAQKVLPEAIRKLDNTEIALFEAMRIIHEKVYKNDSVMTQGAGAPTVTAAEIRSQIMKLRAEPAYKNWEDPKHKAIKKQVDDLYLEEHRLTTGAE